MRTMLLIVGFVLGHGIVAEGAIITFTGTVTDRKGDNLLPAEFAQLVVTITDRAGNVQTLRRVGTPPNRYRFTFDTATVSGLEEKALLIEFHAGQTRVPAQLNEVLGMTPGDRDMTTEINVVLPVREPAPPFCYPSPAHVYYPPTCASGSYFAASPRRFGWCR